jgi:hypothetical protein
MHEKKHKISPEIRQIYSSFYVLHEQKKRGGWPKGRKRKPELLEMRPPKAPATGYVLFLNEKRKQYKDLPFPEVKELQNVRSYVNYKEEAGGLKLPQDLKKQLLHSDHVLLNPYDTCQLH